MSLAGDKKAQFSSMARDSCIFMSAWYLVDRPMTTRLFRSLSSVCSQRHHRWSHVWWIISRDRARTHLSLVSRPGWLTSDLAPQPGAVKIDVAEPFPISDSVFDFAYSEHMIEHVSFRQRAAYVEGVLPNFTTGRGIAHSDAFD